MAALPMRLLLPLLLFLLVACNKQESVSPPKVGEVLSDVVFEGLDKGQTTLASLQGKVVVVHFWASWCAPCRRELPSMERLTQSLDGEKFIVLGISVDEDAEAVKQFKAKYNIRFANHIDSGMALAKGRFGVTAFPETFLISRDGRVLRHLRGEHEWDTPAMRTVLEDAYSGKQSQAGEFW